MRKRVGKDGVKTGVKVTILHGSNTDRRGDHGRVGHRLASRPDDMGEVREEVGKKSG